MLVKERYKQDRRKFAIYLRTIHEWRKLLGEHVVNAISLHMFNNTTGHSISHWRHCLGVIHDPSQAKWMAKPTACFVRHYWAAMPSRCPPHRRRNRGAGVGVCGGGGGGGGRGGEDGDCPLTF